MPTVHLDDSDDPVEVSSDQIDWGDESPDGFVSREYFQNEIDSRIEKAKNATREETQRKLKRNDEFIREVAQDRLGIEFDDDGNPVTGSDGPDPEKLRSRWDRDVLQPVKEEKENLQETVQHLRNRDRRREIVEAAQQVGIKKSYLTPLKEGSDPPIVKYVADEFGYNDEHEMWAEKDGDGFRYSSNPEDGKPLAGPREFFSRLKKQDEFAEWFEDNRPGSTGTGGSSSGGTRGGTKQVSRQDLSKGKVDPQDILDDKVVVQQ